MRLLFATIALLASSAVMAPAQQVGPAFMQRAFNALAAERSQAMDNAVTAEVRAAGLADERAKAQACIKELESKSAPKE
jgi:hypothetical protein